MIERVLNYFAGPYENVASTEWEDMQTFVEWAYENQGRDADIGLLSGLFDNQLREGSPAAMARLAPILVAVTTRERVLGVIVFGVTSPDGREHVVEEVPMKTPDEVVALFINSIGRTINVSHRNTRPIFRVGYFDQITF